MKISPMNNTSFGRLVIDDNGGRTIEALSKLAQNADTYASLKSALDKIDKNTGTDTVVLSGDTEVQRLGSYPMVDVRLTTRNIDGEEINTILASGVHFRQYPPIDLSTAGRKESFNYAKGMEAFAKVPGYKPSSESIKNLASLYPSK